MVQSGQYSRHPPSRRGPRGRGRRNERGLQTKTETMLPRTNGDCWCTMGWVATQDILSTPVRAVATQAFWNYRLTLTSQTSRCLTSVCYLRSTTPPSRTKECLSTHTTKGRMGIRVPSRTMIATCPVSLFLAAFGVFGKLWMVGSFRCISKRLQQNMPCSCGSSLAKKHKSVTGSFLGCLVINHMFSCACHDMLTTSPGTGE